MTERRKWTKTLKASPFNSRRSARPAETPMQKEGSGTKKLKASPFNSRGSARPAETRSTKSTLKGSPNITDDTPRIKVGHPRWGATSPSPCYPQVVPTYGY
ncbi:MAG: hypothetical protein Q4C03_07805 [bacterium]|nr:hypothetical protein [bacterium]